MNRPARHPRRIAAAVATLAVAAGAAAVVAGLALAASPTLQVGRHATVINQLGATVRENIVVTGRRRAVYTLSGDSARHPKCTRGNGCLALWPPVTVASAAHLSLGAGVRGRLGTWRRGGFVQVTLAGHPLYRFSQDSRRLVATGEDLRSFGGTWHVVKAAGTHSAPPPQSSTTTTSSTSYPGY